MKIIKPYKYFTLNIIILIKKYIIVNKTIYFLVKNEWSKYEYPCSRCVCAASQAGNLKIHVECKHSELKYPCSECEFFETTARNLRRHVENKHKEMS